MVSAVNAQSWATLWGLPGLVIRGQDAEAVPAAPPLLAQRSSFAPAEPPNAIAVNLLLTPESGLHDFSVALWFLCEVIARVRTVSYLSALHSVSRGLKSIMLRASVGIVFLKSSPDIAGLHTMQFSLHSGGTLYTRPCR